jgi:large subunit ribosomal protein L31
MRTGIHPDYVECKVHCSCGSTFTTRSTEPELHIELCSQCHPFYTGKQKFVDTGGRVQRFADKFGGAAETVMAQDAAKKEARQKAHEEAETAKREAKAIKDAADAEKERKAAARAPKPKAAAEDIAAAEMADTEPAAAAEAEAETVEATDAETVAVDETPAEESAE